MNDKSKWGISEYLRLAAVIAGGVCIGAGILMTYQGKTMSLANVSIPAGLVFLIAGLVLFSIALPRSTHQEEWWESKWMWAVIIVILGAVIFGIVQPFIWPWVHKETPPPGTVDLADLLTIILALVALAVTGFAILAYRDLRHRLGESIRKELDVESKILIGRIEGGVAFDAWRTWLLGWRVNQPDHELLSSVISSQIGALDLIGEVEPERIRALSEDTKRSINQQKSNLAGYIVENLRLHADKVSQEERARLLEIARRYGKEAYDEAGKFGNNYDWKANYGALLKFFGTDLDEKRMGKEIISEIERRYKAGEISEQEIQDYRRLFGTTNQ